MSSYSWLEISNEIPYRVISDAACANLPRIVKHGENIRRGVASQRPPSSTIPGGSWLLVSLIAACTSCAAEIDGAITAELVRDRPVAERAARRRLRETEDLAELAARRPVKAATESKKPAHADQINCSSFR
jgi:hypothetical protein